jgi:MoaA/NifB/PqqE/SkfB family radical SAM enzyme
MEYDGAIDSLDRIFLVVTNRCNARCKLCHYWNSKPQKFLPLSVIQQEVIPLISKYQVRLTFVTGGEPTLHPHLPEILRALKETGTRITLITNGGRLNAVFEEIKDQVDAYMFSIDAGNKEIHHEIRGLDNFDEIIAWPGRILEQQPSVQAAFTCLLQKKNVHDLVNFYLLAADLPIDAIFFNVPELKPYCFGRQEDIPPESRENAIPDDEEIALLEKNLKKIMQLDLGRGKLFQQEAFFENCVRYFRLLRKEQNVEGALNDLNEVCRVPFTGIVFDESQRIHPCFYLPYSVPSGNFEEDVINGEYLKNLRKEISNNPEFRKKYCSFCLQFQG